MASENLNGIGYWYNWHEPDLPFPQDLVGEYEPGAKAKVLEYLNDERHSREADQDSSHCCFEDCDGLHGDGDVGNLDVSDGTWIWPEGLRHYVEAHNVTLPPAFVQHAQEEPRQSDVSFVRKRTLGEWKEWAASCGTGELRERAIQAQAMFAQWGSLQGSDGIAGYYEAPTRGLADALAESALGQWVWTGGPLPKLP